MLEEFEFIKELFQKNFPYLIKIKETIDKAMEIPLFKWMGIIGTTTTIICSIITIIKHRRISI